MKKTTVVFDLDGTLLDTLQDLANAVNYALEQQGMPKRTLEEVRQFVGNGVRLLMIRAVPDGEKSVFFCLFSSSDLLPVFFWLPL